MSDKWIPTRDALRIANKINRRSVVGWRMVGASYRNGRRMPGYVHLLLSGGGWRYFPEDTALSVALDDADDCGFDTTEARANLQRWIETGEGATFRLTR